MTHQKDHNLSSYLKEELIANGLNGVPELIKIMLDNAIYMNNCLDLYIYYKIYYRLPTTSLGLQAVIYKFGKYYFEVLRKKYISGIDPNLHQ